MSVKNSDLLAIKDSANELFEFQPEDTASIPNRLDPWQILAVDDDHHFQKTTAFALQGVNILGRPIELTQAYSMAEASTMLANNPNLQVVLLDVVMETDHAGLRLVKAIREVLGNAVIRIILVTGQPGMAPIRDVMSDYDINAYFLKTELNTLKLIGILTAELRTFNQLHTISTARRGLQLILESSNRLLNKHELKTYCDAALTEIALLLGLSPEGIICARVDQIYGKAEGNELINEVIIVGAAGKLRSLIGKSIDNLPDDEVKNTLLQAIRTKNNIEINGSTTLFFPKEKSGADFVIYLPTERTLLDTERQLLYVFASNISGGLHNVALFSQLDRLAYNDSLLNIPNKNALIRAIDHALLSMKPWRWVLLIVDLDDFARTNHTFGVACGDALLRQFSQRLQAMLTVPTIVARIDNDVFGILGANECVSENDIRSALAKPFDIDSTKYSMTACIARVSLAQVEGGGRDAIRVACLALKKAKQLGPGSTLQYEKDLEVTAIKRFQVLHRLRQALDNQQLFLVFQPKIELSSGSVAGVEALVRWKFAGSIVPPDEFIPVAEASTLIHNLGYLVLEEVCNAIESLRTAGKKPPMFCVNVSGKQFSDPDMVKSTLKLLDARQINPRLIELEVTETAMMESFETVSDALRQFRQAGGRVAIDDFGTGYSSLKYLQQLPADTLKIDRSFVSKIASDNGGSIAEMVIQLARSLDMKVVAEGVETEQQVCWLRKHQCDIGQGWFFGRPMPLNVFIEWLQDQQIKTP